MPLPSTILYPSGGGGGGAGDVVGPASSTDNAIARYDGTTGKLLQDSPITVADTTGSITMTSTGQYLWSTDTGLARSAAGVVKVTDGSTGLGKLLTTSNGEAITFGTTPNVAMGYRSDVAAFWLSVGSSDNNMLNVKANGAISVPYNGSFSFGYLTPGAADVGIARDGAGGSPTKRLRITNGGSGLGNLLHGVVVEANTAGSGAPNVIVENESGSVFTNEGATAANYHTLPTAVAGYVFTFIVQDADGLRVTAAAADTIRVIDEVTAAAGYIESTTIGSTVTLISINATEWFTTSINGVWTDGTWSYDDTSLTSP